MGCCTRAPAGLDARRARPANMSPGSGGGEFGGAHAAEAGEPAPFWSVTLRVADCDAIAARAVELGGSVVAPATDLPGPSRLAVLADPAGGVFATMSFG